LFEFTVRPKLFRTLNTAEFVLILMLVAFSCILLRLALFAFNNIVFSWTLSVPMDIPPFVLFPMTIDPRVCVFPTCMFVVEERGSIIGTYKFAVAVIFPFALMFPHDVISPFLIVCVPAVIGPLMVADDAEKSSPT